MEQNLYLIHLSYLILFGLFISMFLIFFNRFVSRLYVEAKQSKEKLNFILDSSKIVTYTYDLSSEELFVKSGRKAFPQFPTEYHSKSAIIWRQFVHSDDIDKLQHLDEQLLLGKVRNVEYRLVLPTNNTIWVQCRLIPIIESATTREIEGVLVDITEQKFKEEKMTYLAYHDQLTGLPNRSKLQDEFSLLLAAKKQAVFIIFIDLDEFKSINDTYGHILGDDLLKIVAKRLINCIRDSHIVSRISGDEFVVVLSEVTEDDVMIIVNRIKTTLASPYSIENKEITITTSIGIYRYADKAEDLNEMIKRADFAMYRAKKQGKNEICFYDEEERSTS